MMGFKKRITYLPPSLFYDDFLKAHWCYAGVYLYPLDLKNTISNMDYKSLGPHLSKLRQLKSLRDGHQEQLWRLPEYGELKSLSALNKKRFFGLNLFRSFSENEINNCQRLRGLLKDQSFLIQTPENINSNVHVTRDGSFCHSTLFYSLKLKIYSKLLKLDLKSIQSPKILLILKD